MKAGCKFFTCSANLLILPSVLFLFWGGSAHAAPSPQIISVTYPTTITNGDWATIAVEVNNTGSTSDDGGISLSIPSFTSSTDGSYVTNNGSSSAIPGYRLHPQGSLIWPKVGTNQITASYMLVEWSDNNWLNGEHNYLKVKVKPKSTGTFIFQVRSAMGTTGVYVGMPISGPIDQQGWWVQQQSITVVAAAPEIDIKGNGVSIPDGDTTPSTGDYTDFGSTMVGTTVSRTFYVYNTGTAALTPGTITVPNGFMLTVGLVSSIPAGGSDYFTVRLNATSASTYAGDISIPNNDSNENPYNFRIIGTVSPVQGSLIITVQNHNGETRSGAKVVRYGGGMPTVTNITGSAGTTTLAGMTVSTSCTFEAYYEGANPFDNQGELWAATGWVVSAGSSSLTMRRDYPYAEDLRVYRVNDGSLLAAGSVIQSGEQVRIQAVIRNKRSESRTVRTQVVLDRNQARTFDCDITNTYQPVSGNGILTQTVVFTLSQTGAYWKAVRTEDQTAGKIDAWDWAPTFTVVPPPQGTLVITVQNQNGETRSGAKVVRYGGGMPTVTNITGSAGTTTLAGMTVGSSCTFEAYYEGTNPFDNQGELWAATGWVVSAGSSSLTMRRDYPYAEDLRVYRVNDGSLLAAGSVIQSGEQVRIQAVIRNKRSESRTVRTQVVLDRNQARTFDCDITNTYQPVSGNGILTQTVVFTLSQTGAYWKAVRTEDQTAGKIDAWDWAPTFTVVPPPQGTLVITVQNQNGETRSGAKVVRYGGGMPTVTNITGSAGTTTLAGMTVGSSCTFEAYYEGTNPFDNQGELWAATGWVVSAGSSSLTMRRDYPYAEDLRVYRINDGSLLASGSVIQSGEQVRIQAVIRNKRSESRTVRTQVVLDRNQARTFDCDTTNAYQSVSGNGMLTQTVVFTLSQTGAYWKAVRTEDQTAGKIDAWDWVPTFAVVSPISLKEVRQLSDGSGRVHLDYSLALPSDGLAQVEVSFSSNGGILWDVTPRAGTLTGDYGTGITSGDHGITWNAAAQLPATTYNNNFRARIVTTTSGVSITTISPLFTVDLRGLQGGLTVAGKIRDATTGLGLGSVDVALAGQNTLSSPDGSYLFSNVVLANGNTITASKSGFATFMDTIPAPPGCIRSVPLDINLAPVTGIRPVVTSLRAKYDGLFVSGVSVDNEYTATVDWRDRTPGKVHFTWGCRTQSLQHVEVTTSYNAATAQINMGLGLGCTFQPGDNRTVVQAEDSTGMMSDEFIKQVGVIPLPVILPNILPSSWVEGGSPRIEWVVKIPPELLQEVCNAMIPSIGKFIPDFTIEGSLEYSLLTGEWEFLFGKNREDKFYRRRGRPYTHTFLDPTLTVGAWKQSIAYGFAANGVASQTRGIELTKIGGFLTLETKAMVEQLVSDLIPAAKFVRLVDVLKPFGFDLNSVQRVVLYLVLGLDSRLMINMSPLGFDDSTTEIKVGPEVAYEPDLAVLKLRIYFGGRCMAIAAGVPVPQIQSIAGELYGGIEGEAFGLPVMNEEYILRGQFWPPSEQTSRPLIGALSGNVPSGNWVWLPVKCKARKTINRRYLLAGSEGFALASTDVKRRTLLAAEGETISPLEAFRGMKGCSVSSWNDISMTSSLESTAPHLAQTALPIITNAFPYSEPALAARAQELMLLWVADNGNSNDLQSADIRWSWFDGSHWSTPTSIVADTRADFAPKVVFDGNGDAIAVWQKVTNPNFTNTALLAMTAEMEIVWSRWDRISGLWSTPIPLTTNNYYDGSPLLAGPMTNGDLLLAWTKNEANLLMGTGTVGSVNNDTIMWSRWNLSTKAWKKPAVLVSNLTYRLSQSFVGVNNRAVYAWTADRDGLLTNDTDQALFVCQLSENSWLEPLQYPTNGLSNKNIHLAVSPSEDVYAIWQEGANLVMDVNFSGNQTLVRADAQTVGFADYAMTYGPQGNIVLLWQEMSTNGSDTRYSVYDPTSGTWSKNATLFNDSALERSFSPVWDDAGNLNFAYNKVEIILTNKTVELEEGGFVTVSNVPQEGRVDIGVMVRRLITDVAIMPGDFTVDGVNYLPYDAITLSTRVRNVGDIAVSNLMVAFYDGNPTQSGTLITNLFWSGWLEGAATNAVLSALWVVPEPATNRTLYAVANAGHMFTEFTANNNTQSVAIGGTDLSVSLISAMPETNGAMRVIAQVHNLGAPTATNSTLALRRMNTSGAPLSTVGVPALEPGRLAQVALDLSPATQPQGEAFYTLFADETHGIPDVDTNNNTVTFAVDLLPPAGQLWSPTGVSASDGIYSDKVEVTWNASGNATAYEVWRHAGNDTNQAGRIADHLTATRYDDFSVLAGQTNYYWVKAKNADGVSDFSAPDSGYRSVTPPRGTLQFASETYRVSENGGSVEIGVSRTGGSYGLAGVNFATADGTAAAGSDYTTTNGTLTWTDGDGADKFFDVPILNDDMYEGDKWFAANLSGVSGAGLGSPASTTVTIADDEQLTRIIGVTGNLAFGSVVTGQISTATMTITNSGNWALTVTGISYPTGFSGAWSGSIGAGKATNVTVTFAPMLVQAYGGLVTVGNNATSGGNTLNASGMGIPAPTSSVATPTFAPDGGSYASALSVTVECVTADAIIHYTTTGVDPTESDPPVPSGGTVPVGQTLILKARAYKTGMIPSAVMSATYTITSVLIPAGDFQMGDSFNDGYSDELPVHFVDVSAFYMDRYEVTKALWDEVANWAATHGYDISAGSGSGKAVNHPVYYVSWYECIKWCNARSEKSGLTPCYYTSSAHTAVYRSGATNIPIEAVDWNANGYRLPTEAEWEKAARGGTGGHRFPWSDTDTIQHARSNYRSDSGYSYDTSPTRDYHPAYSNSGTPYTSPVGSFAANGYGLCDMAGNVWEWCWDLYSNYNSSPGADPRGATSGSARVTRGGSWGNYAYGPRVTYRAVIVPHTEHHYLGFRCARGFDTASAGIVQWKSATYAVSETGKFVRLWVSRTGGLSGAASVNYATSNGTAMAGSDYATTNGTLTWTDGDGADKFFDVPILNDDMYEGDKWFAATLSGVSGAGLGSPTSTTVTVADDERPRILTVSMQNWDGSVPTNVSSLGRVVRYTSGWQVIDTNGPNSLGDVYYNGNKISVGSNYYFETYYRGANPFDSGDELWSSSNLTVAVGSNTLTLRRCFPYADDVRVRNENPVFTDEFTNDLSSWTNLFGMEKEWWLENGELRGNYNIGCGSVGCRQSDLILKSQYQLPDHWRASVRFIRNQTMGYDHYCAVGSFSIWLSNSGNRRLVFDMGGAGFNNWGGPQTNVGVWIQYWNGYAWSGITSSNYNYLWNPEDWHEAALEKQGNVYTISMDDMVTHVYTDTVMNGAGEVGFHAYGTRRYDRFMLTSLNTSSGNGMGEKAPLGSSLIYSARVTNKGSSSQLARIVFRNDRDQILPYDYEQVSDAQEILANGGMTMFTMPPHTPSEQGTYHGALEVQTWINGNWVKTDSWMGGLVNVMDNNDSDGDGLSDWAEWIAGTDPSNDQSHFQFGFPVSGVYAPNGIGVVLQWYSVSNRVYHLNRSTNLNGEFNRIPPTDIPATPSLNVHTDTTATGMGPYFYKVGVEKAP